jgi:hypothetical protein
MNKLADYLNAGSKASGKIKHKRREERRKRKPRVFFTPSEPTKKTYISELEQESAKIRSDCVKYTDLVRARNQPSTNDPYTKDSLRAECFDKKITNAFLANQAKRGSSCLILDGSKARTTKRLLSVGVGSVLIPNNNYSTFTKLAEFANCERSAGKVSVVNDSLNDVVTSTRRRYDIIYMDTCGMFTTGSSIDLRSTIYACFYRKLLKEGGVFGLTITSRTNGTIVDAKNHCDQWVTKQSGLTNIFTHVYGPMITMFYK